MPGSGTLESLSIEINANSQKASEGIGRLVGSLRSLSKAVGTALAPMRALNTEIKALTKAGAIKLPQVGQITAGETAKATKEIKAQTAAIQERANAMTGVSKVAEEAKYTGHPRTVRTPAFNPNNATIYDPRTGNFVPVSEYKPETVSQPATSPNPNADPIMLSAQIRKLQPDFKLSDLPSRGEHMFTNEAGYIKELQDHLAALQAPAQQAQESLKSVQDAMQQSAPTQSNVGQNVTEPMNSVAESAKNATDAVKPVQDALGNGLANSAKTATSALKDTDRELKQKKTDGKAAKDGLDQAAQGAKSAGEAAGEASKGMKDAGDAAQDAAKKGKSAGGILGKIGKMFQSMLIRTAIRNVMKAFSEAWTSAYAFSDHMNGSFAKSIDSMRTAFSSTAIEIIKTFAPVLESLVPIVNVVASAIQYLCSGIQWLLGLLGMTSDLLGATDKQISRFGGKNNSNSSKDKKKKNMLADWDELNIIQSHTGDSSSGGGGSGHKISDFAKAEIDDVTSVLVGFGMMALGLIMCATGHLPIGLGMIAVGAAAVVQTLAVKWGKMSDEVKKQVAKIMVIASTAFLAIGLILAFTGQIGIGIAAIAIGVAGIVGTVAVSWGDGASAGVKQSIVKIMAIASVSLMAIGLILALTGVGLGVGIGMMAAGALMWYGAGSLDWDYLVTLVGKALSAVKKVVKEAFEKVKKVAGDAWDKVSEWWNTNIGDPVKEKWDAVKKNVSSAFENVKKKASDAWTTVSKWWADNIEEPVKDAWDSTKTFFSTLFGDSSTDGSIAKAASDAWTSVKGWWASSTIGTTISSAWDTAKSYLVTFFGDPDDPTTIAGTFKTTWDLASQWWGDIYTFVSTAWDSVSTYFSTLWGGPGTGIYGYFESMWTEISKLWGDIMKPIEEAWKAVALWFETYVTTPIKDAFKGAMNWVIDRINDVIKGLNALGNFTLPEVSFDMPGFLGGAHVQVMAATPITLWNIGTIAPFEYAEGGYDIPKGDLFIANEAGAELIGSMNGRTAVANQGQIVEGIRLGVRDANAEQNALLTRQNELLLAILQKSGNINLEPTMGWGKHNQISSEMWNKATGG